MKAMLVAAVCLSGSEVYAESQAARYLADQQIAEACPGGTGTIAPEGLIERDLKLMAGRICCWTMPT